MLNLNSGGTNQQEIEDLGFGFASKCRSHKIALRTEANGARMTRHDHRLRSLGDRACFGVVVTDIFQSDDPTCSQRLEQIVISHMSLMNIDVPVLNRLVVTCTG